MKSETLSRSDELLIRRQVLAPGEAMDWHTDRCRRFTVVVTGSRLAIEYRDTGESLDVDVHPGMAGWDEPEPRTHRAINRSIVPYEEVVIFRLGTPNMDPQPISEP